MKKSINIALFLLIFFAASVNSANATSGACSWHGGVNCAAGPDWDGSVICNDGWRDSSVSYYSMDKCQYNYYNYPSTPDCPLMSYYDSLSGSCKCFSGYVVDIDFLGNQTCVSGDTKCREEYGYGARYNSLINKCECSYGYIMYEGRCIDEDDYCRDTYSYFHSRYNSLFNRCECDYDYKYNGVKCVDEDDWSVTDYSNYNWTMDDLCKALYGNNSYAIGNSCYCKAGYIWNTDKTSCIEKKSEPEEQILCHGAYKYYDEATKSCKCSSGAKMINGECIKEQTIISPGQVLGSSYSESNPLGLQSGWLIKNKEFVEVFSVDENLCLHWIINEDAAERFYGPTWNHYGVIKEFDNIPLGYKFCENID